MPTLIYIHGFLSSPYSYKAQQVEKWLAERHPDIRYQCPLLTPYPSACAKALEQCIQQAQREDQDIYLMGSSMGGFWATYFAEKYHFPAVLINPAVDVLGLMPKYINQTLKNYHTDDTYCLKSDDLHQLSRYDTSIIHQKNNYWLLVQTDDETCDYQLAVKKYQGCRQTVEVGGDHSFQGFERFHQASLHFFEQYYRQKN